MAGAFKWRALRPLSKTHADLHPLFADTIEAMIEREIGDHVAAFREPVQQTTPPPVRLPPPPTAFASVGLVVRQEAGRRPIGRPRRA